MKKMRPFWNKIAAVCMVAALVFPTVRAEATETDADLELAYVGEYFEENTIHFYAKENFYQYAETYSFEVYLDDQPYQILSADQVTLEEIELSEGEICREIVVDISGYYTDSEETELMLRADAEGVGAVEITVEYEAADILPYITATQTSGETTTEAAAETAAVEATEAVTDTEAAESTESLATEPVPVETDYTLYYLLAGAVALLILVVVLILVLSKKSKKKAKAAEEAARAAQPLGQQAMPQMQPAPQPMQQMPQAQPAPQPQAAPALIPQPMQATAPLPKPEAAPQLTGRDSRTIRLTRIDKKEMESREFTITRSNPLTIGRNPSMSLMVISDDSKVSKLHCKIALDAEGELVLLDLSSTNGTFINGVAIQQQWYLADNDVLGVGFNEWRINF